MPDSIVKPATVYGLFVLVLCFGGCDAWLLTRLKHQDTSIATLQYENQIISQAPMPGQLVPLIQGISLKNKQPLAVKLSSSPRLVLLVFRQGCKFCEDNWKNWNELFGSTKPEVPLYMITSDESLSGAYIDQHSLVKQSDVLLGVDPEVLRAFDVTSTP